MVICMHISALTELKAIRIICHVIFCQQEYFILKKNNKKIVGKHWRQISFCIIAKAEKTPEQ